MIVADASAVLAILLNEADRPDFIAKLNDAPRVVMSPVNYREVLCGAQALDGVGGVERAEQVMRSLDIQVVAIDLSTAQTDAFTRFGKRTPAALNLGDCFAYALAKQRNAPLLFKSADFAKTDIAAA